MSLWVLHDVATPHQTHKLRNEQNAWLVCMLAWYGMFSPYRPLPVAEVENFTIPLVALHIALWWFSTREREPDDTDE